ncbi:hypothetical protein HELRODRAFT_171884 [Helobdella robusta]|uniref:Uncharacterized protein n=1 Tax=Helobdella robusta TaxID=6412 RepID=T1F4T0_HELRO|nr:hypothetical protein HELRODRAFT_171884 [Helobdella robusta]ESO04882.1 hypothetical protein HELRODRAFT_171884 [Helobdella robusta]
MASAQFSTCKHCPSDRQLEIPKSQHQNQQDDELVQKMKQRRHQSKSLRHQRKQHLRNKTENETKGKKAEKPMKYRHRFGPLICQYGSLDGIHMSFKHGTSLVRRPVDKNNFVVNGNGQNQSGQYRATPSSVFSKIHYNYSRMKFTNSNFGRNNHKMTADANNNKDDVKTKNKTSKYNDRCYTNNTNDDTDFLNINNNRSVLEFEKSAVIRKIIFESKDDRGLEYVEVHTTSNVNIVDIIRSDFINLARSRSNNFATSTPIINDKETKGSKHNQTEKSSLSKKCGSTFLPLKDNFNKFDLSGNDEKSKAECENDKKENNIPVLNKIKSDDNINDNIIVQTNFPNRITNADKHRNPSSKQEKTMELDISLNIMMHKLTDKCLKNMGKPFSSLVQYLSNKDCNNRSPLTKQSRFIKRFFLAKHLVNSCETSGLYISCLQSCSGRLLLTLDSILPTFKVNVDHVGDIENHFYWLMKVTSDWQLAENLKKIMKKEIGGSKKVETIANGDKDLFPVRHAILKAVSRLQKLTRCENLGRLHWEIFKEGHSSVLVFVNEITVASSPRPSLFSPSSSSPSHLSSSPLTWMPIGDLSSSHSSSSPSSSKSTLLKYITLKSLDILSTSEQQQMEQGMYIGYLKLAVRVQGLDILVSKQHLSSLPCIKVDGDDGDDSDEDVKMVVKYTNVFDDGDGASMRDNSFKNMLQTKCHQLIDTVTTETAASTEAVEEEEADEPTIPTAHRLHKLTFPLKHHVNMTLLAPQASLVCSPLQGKLPTPPPSCTYLPFKTFEMLHLNTYQPQIYRKYCQLSAILDLVTETCRRRKIRLQDCEESESRDDKLAELLELSKILQSIQREMNETWTKHRWIGDVISQARLTSSKDYVSLEELFTK